MPKIKEVPINGIKYRAYGEERTAEPGGAEGNRPFFYDPEEDTIYLGEENFHHPHLAAAIWGEDRYDYPKNVLHGRIQTTVDPDRPWWGLRENLGDFYLLPGRSPNVQYDEDALKEALYAHLNLGDPQSPDWEFNSAAHRLGWQPGSTGKGIVLPDESVITWNTDRLGAPHHGEKLLEVLDRTQLTADAFKTAFNIQPNGEVIMGFWPQRQGITEVPGIIMEADPRLRVRGGGPTERWKMTANQVNVVQLEPLPEMTQGGESGTPFFYHSDTNTLYLGHEGDTHGRTIRNNPTLRALYDAEGADLTSTIPKAPQAMTHGRWYEYNNKVEWYDELGMFGHRPVDRSVKEQIAQQQGWDYEPEDNRWHFGVAQEPIPGLEEASQPLKLVHLETGQSDYPVSKYRYPFAYDPAEHTVYLGNPGNHHSEIFEALGREWGADAQGQRAGEGAKMGFTYVYPDDDGNLSARDWFWYQHPGDEVDTQARTMVLNHLGASDDVDDDEGWDFESRHRLGFSDHQLSWEPGNPGKALIADGAVHTWNVDEAGRPWHGHYMDAQGLNGANAYLYINEDGSIDDYLSDGLTPENAQLLMEADPNLRVENGLDFAL